MFGYYTVSGSAVAGEAKRGPELWASRDQIQDVAMALPYYGPTGGGALLILAVSMGWEADAGELCRTIHASRTATAIWSPES